MDALSGSSKDEIVQAGGWTDGRTEGLPSGPGGRNQVAESVAATESIAAVAEPTVEDTEAILDELETRDIEEEVAQELDQAANSESEGIDELRAQCALLEEAEEEDAVASSADSDASDISDMRLLD